MPCPTTRRPLPVRLLPAFVVLAAILFGMFSARASELVLTGDDVAVSAAGHLSVLRDADGQMTLDDVMAAGAGFEPIPGTFNAGYSKGAWWLRLTVRTGDGGAGEWLLELTAPFTDIIDIYAPTARDGQTTPLAHSRAGGLVPPAERDLLSHLHVVRTDLPAGASRDIYMRLSGKRALSAAPTLWRVSPYLRHATAHAVLISIIVGAAGITALGSIIFGLWLRSSAFAWYGVYLSFAALVVLGNSGLTAFLLPNVPPTLILRLQGVIGCTTILAGALMIRAIFCGNGQHPIIARIFAAVALVALMGAGAAALGYYGTIAPVLIAALLLLCALVPWLALGRIRRREPAAKWYGFGFSAYSLSGIWFCLMVLGIVPTSTMGERAYQISALLTMVAIFVGLATSVRAGARERRTLQEELLRASQQNTRALEQAVAQRTAALEAEIDRRHAAEAALLEAMREQRHFLGIVSHEFRTPLASIRVAIALIERRLAEADVVARREAARIVRTIGRLSQLIDTFLAEEVLDKSSVQLRRAPVHLPALTQDICREHAAQSGRDIRFQSDHVPVIQADQDLLRTAIDNLVHNAVRHTRGLIRVSIETEERAVTIAVEDEGPGIPEDQRHLIFERYYRVPDSASQAGAGIGLSLVRKIATLHGGTVGIAGAPSGGSRFSLRLPLDAPPLVTTAPLSSSAS